MKINRLFMKINRLFMKINRLFMKMNKVFFELLSPPLLKRMQEKCRIYVDIV